MLNLVCILLSIAFLTLFERNLLSFSQSRLGPNNVSFLGLLQPVLDGVNLLFNEAFLPSNNTLWGFIFGPSVGFFVIIFLWIIFNSSYNTISTFYSFLFIISLIGVSVYSTLISGWSGGSKFSSMGGVRSCSQSISYEISLILLLLSGLVLISSLSSFSLNLFFISPVFILLFLSFVAETNRAPFDFSEGESELISGFNVEFGCSFFVFLFLAEYGIILFFSLLLSCFFFNSSFTSFLVILASFIFIRSAYPRFRYDNLIELTWISFLPLSIGFLFFFIFFC